jgi:hypothetical protein
MKLRWLVLCIPLLAIGVIAVLWPHDPAEHSGTEGPGRRAALPKEVVDAVQGGTLLAHAWEEYVVSQEATRLGLSATDADASARYERLAASVRKRSDGQGSIDDVLAEEGVTLVVFMRQIRHILLREQVAGHKEHAGSLPTNEQVKIQMVQVVITKLMRSHPLPEER